MFFSVLETARIRVPTRNMGVGNDWKVGGGIGTCVDELVDGEWVQIVGEWVT
jgi:hypothetical protein